MAKDSDIEELISHLTEEVHGLNKTVNTRNENQKITNSKVNTAINRQWVSLILVAVFALIFTSVAYKQGRTIIHDRDNSRVGACNQHNTQVKRAIEGAIARARAAAEDLIRVSDASNDASGKPRTSPAIAKAYIDGQGRAVEKVTREINPYRDCSKEGIKLWLKEAPKEASVDCDPDPKTPGYCKVEQPEQG